jgi:MurNAc alpha-1-phosphate uridylyltransferase
MKAMVMAAGLGTRMRPLTDHLPKPLVKVSGVTLIDRTLDWLYASGVPEAVVNSHYYATLLESHLAARRAPKVILSHEATLLDTGGGIKKALPLLGHEAFFSVNSDTICIDGAVPALKRLQAHRDAANMDVLLLVHPVASAVGYGGKGDFFIDNGTVRRRRPDESAPFIFTGVQLLHPRLFKDAPEGAFSLNLLYDHAMQGDVPRLRALVHDGHWLHVGDPQGLAQAEEFLAKQ